MARQARSAKTRRRTRQLSTPEFVGLVGTSVGALHRAILAFDGGSDLALQEVSSRLRQLVCHGAGNRQLQRLAVRLGAAFPQVDIMPEAGAPLFLTAFPPDVARSAKHLDFAIGGLQAYGKPPPELPTMKATTCSIQEFLDSRALIVSLDTEREAYSWDELLSEVANKLGAVHLDDEVPVALDAIGQYRVLGIHPIAYCLRSAGALICSAAHELLGTAGYDFAHEPHVDGTRGVLIGGVAVGRGDDTPTEKPRFVAALVHAFDRDDRTLLTGPDFEFSVVDGGRLQFAVRPEGTD